jgi:hypothetical protein
MLRRVSPALFEAPAGQRVQIVSRSQSNDGVNAARFEYGGTVLMPPQVIGGLPGCTFTIAPFGQRKRFEALVVFSPAAGDSARYDLFEVTGGGGQVDLQEHVSKSDSAPLIDFVIEGTAAAVGAPPPGPAGAPAPVGAARPPRRAAKKKKKATAVRKKTKKTAVKRKPAAAKKKASKKKVAVRKKRATRRKSTASKRKSARRRGSR